jgi:hypothetical protein
MLLQHGNLLSAFIQNCFSKSSFSTEDGVFAEEKDLNDCDRMELLCQIDCLSNLEDFI